MIHAREAKNISNSVSGLPPDWLTKCRENIEKQIQNRAEHGNTRTLWNRTVYKRDSKGEIIQIPLPDKETEELRKNLSENFGYTVKTTPYNFLEISWE
jgi:hypothetical protein